MSDRWRNIEYLLNGTDKMGKVYTLMQKHDILYHLREFDPIIIGTIPINIDVENSDIDIACEVNDFNHFIDVAKEGFSKYEGFKISYHCNYRRNNVTISFRVEAFEIELFGEALPVIRQNGYRHMIIEDRILRLGGEQLRNKVVELKKNGVKTEPAFASLLNLSGNPYIKLLELEELSDVELIRVMFREGEINTF